MRTILLASIALALLTPFVASAQTATPTSTEIQLLRQEIQSLRAAYEARLQAMEQRLQWAERVVINDPGAASVPAAPVALNTATTGSANAFNPAMSLILSGGYTRTSLDPAR